MYIYYLSKIGMLHTNIIPIHSGYSNNQIDTTKIIPQHAIKHFGNAGRFKNRSRRQKIYAPQTLQEKGNIYNTSWV